jgi:hypothetical protein
MGESVSFELAEHAVDKIAELEAKLRMRYPNGEKTIASTAEFLPAPILKELYMYPSSPHKNTVAELLSSAKPNTPTGLGVHTRVLKKIYEQPDGSVALDFNDPYVHRMAEALHRDEIIFDIASIPEIPHSSESHVVAEFNREVTLAAVQVLEKLGLAEKDADGRYDSPYLKSAFVRLRNRENMTSGRPHGAIDTNQLRAELAQTYDNLTYVGGFEAAKRLKDVFGVEQLWMYSPEELVMMQKLDEKDPITIKHLQAGDVTVVFSNAMDDHNGAIVELANYRKESGRTLRFETTNVEAIYRRMIYLNKLGIKPASLVYETHGLPGGVTDGGSVLWAAEPKHPIGKDDRVMRRDADGLYRLVRDFMQPNRGIDSEDELVGKKQIVVSACSSDKEAAMADGSNASFLEKIAKMVAYPSNRSIRKGIHSRRSFQNNIVLYGALQDMAEMNLENGRVGFVDHKSETQRTVTTKRTINELGLKAELFGTNRDEISTHSIRTRKGVPVRRVAS